MDTTVTAFSIIAQAGDAKSAAIEAAYAAMDNKFSEASELLERCNDALAQVHELQTDMIREEMSGNKQEISLIMVHAQDHLAGAIIMKDMSDIIVKLCSRIERLEGREA